ncbi:MAG: xanthine dehydrogenase family protein subunit M [Streptosporangiales bacterium]|nr:xanthine dehydrogenase family protein subunit M [Streptosporangiales bacterium]
MKPAPFAYRRADTTAEAVTLLADEGDEAKILAGGQSLVPMLNFRLVRPTALIDVSRIDALRYLSRDDDVLRIGALTRHLDIERSADPRIRADFGYLRDAAKLVGHYPIRTAGTMGGSLAHADPSAEWCLLALLLDAEIEMTSLRGRRSVRASDFFSGYYETALEPDEILTEVRLPARWSRVALREFARRSGDFALVSAAVAVELEGDVFVAARVALGGVAPKPVRVDLAEQALVGSHPTDEVLRQAGRLAADDVRPPADVHGSSEYRTKLVAVLVEQALRKAVQR